MHVRRTGPPSGGRWWSGADACMKCMVPTVLMIRVQVARLNLLRLPLSATKAFSAKLLRHRHYCKCNNYRRKGNVAVPWLFTYSGGKQGGNYLEWRSREKVKHPAFFLQIFFLQRVREAIFRATKQQTWRRDWQPHVAETRGRPGRLKRRVKRKSVSRRRMQPVVILLTFGDSTSRRRGERPLRNLRRGSVLAVHWQWHTWHHMTCPPTPWRRMVKRWSRCRTGGVRR